MQLTEEEIRDNLAALREASAARQSEAEAVGVRQADGMRYVHPLSVAADAALEAIENEDERFMLGLYEIDLRTRGLGAKELMLITGFSHSGKTQLINTAILHNRDKRILFFSMDDPEEMILIKLVCMLTDTDAETLERKLRNRDTDARLKFRQAATHTFANLAVVDQSLGLVEMDKAIEEYKRLHGGVPHVVIIDYVASMHGDGDEDDGIKRKVAALKRWLKDKPFGVIAVHQNSRSNGAPGEPITMLSGGYGGEDAATFIIGVRRKKDWKELDGFAREQHESTVTLHLVKNKRPPGKLTSTDGHDYEMNRDTGLIRARRENLTTAEEALAAKRDSDG